VVSPARKAAGERSRCAPLIRNLLNFRALEQEPGPVQGTHRRPSEGTMDKIPPDGCPGWHL